VPFGTLLGPQFGVVSCIPTIFTVVFEGVLKALHCRPCAVIAEQPEAPKNRTLTNFSWLPLTLVLSL